MENSVTVLSRIESKLDNVESKLDALLLQQMPFLNDAYKQIQVIGSGEIAATSVDGKRSTWTWFDYGIGGKVIVGAAHCAIPLILPTKPNDLFVELPRAILKLGVQEVFLVGPYESDYKSPLPVEKDLIVIRTADKSPANVNLPAYNRMTPEKRKNTRACHIVGRGIDHPVQSKGGTLLITTNKLSRGHFSFLLNLGEPGDSGTLLFDLVPSTDRMVPIGVFRGIKRHPNSDYMPRGVGAMFPPFETLTRLPVKPGPFQMEDIPALGMNRLGHVRIIQEGQGVVRLLERGGTQMEFVGVFVETHRQISYDGMADINTLRGFRS